jgi:hypothetical protein
MFEKDPSLESIKDGLVEPPPNRTANQKRMRRLISLLMIFVLVLAVVSLVNSSIGSQVLRGTGSIEGVVLTSQGAPFQGEILVLGTDRTVRTNANGGFLLEGVPSGEQSLILLADEGGNEVRVNIPSGGKLSLGVVRFTETATP